MKEIKIFEFGACSMLDHEIPEGIDWTKRKHKNEPEYYSNIVDRFPELDLLPYDAYIFSSSVRDDNSKPNVNDVVDCNVHKFSMDLIGLSNQLDKQNLTGKLLILLGSISANQGQTYSARPYYAATKAYQRTLFRNIAELDKDNYYIEYSLPSVQTRMCNHGINSKIVFDQLISDLFLFKNYFNNSNYKLIQFEVS